MAQIGARGKSMGQCSIIFFGTLGIAVRWRSTGNWIRCTWRTCGPDAASIVAAPGCWCTPAIPNFIYILSGNAALTRLDGEWCMRFALENN